LYSKTDRSGDVRTKLIAGNWKMNTSMDEAIELATSLRESLRALDSVERALIPPFPWLVPVCKIIEGSGLKLGAQNCYTEASGAFTGEVAPEMLAGICEYVIAGHSERRHVLGESNELVGGKVAAIERSGMKPILCVGETIEQREDGSAEAIVARQLETGLAHLDAATVTDVVIAYEPVWAIGTGHAASADDAQSMSAFIRGWLQDRFGEQVAVEMRILYGGSVKPDNAGQYMACPDVDGALVGGASLNAEQFTGIVQAAAS
jgi:triosephosphate isomerase (TIM)